MDLKALTVKQLKKGGVLARYIYFYSDFVSNITDDVITDIYDQSVISQLIKVSVYSSTA